MTGRRFVHILRHCITYVSPWQTNQGMVSIMNFVTDQHLASSDMLHIGLFMDELSSWQVISAQHLP